MSITDFKTPSRDHVSSQTMIGDEISITGKWVPKTADGLFRKSSDNEGLLNEWANIHKDASQDPNILHTEINHAVGEKAILVHHVFRNPQSVLDYFGTTASKHAQDLRQVAKPQLHFVHGLDVPKAITEVLNGNGVPTATGCYSYGFARDYFAPDPKTAIEVVAKWACNPGATTNNFEELTDIWRQVGNQAFETEMGMKRFEVYKIAGEDALITRETFDTTDELKFHLTKGTASKFKPQLDKIAAPENYYFRGPVSWLIRTYSKFMHLPATYSSLGSHHTKSGGSMSSGKTI